MAYYTIQLSANKAVVVPVAGRVILVRYVWLDLSPKSARMEQSFSPDGGKSWEINWICELSR